MATGEILAAIIAAIASLVTIFFGREYWRSYSGLITDLKAETVRLQTVVREQRSRLDRVEGRLHQRELELTAVHSNLDNYVATAQNLTEENRQLRERVRQLETKSSQAKPQSSPN